MKNSNPFLFIIFCIFILLLFLECSCNKKSNNDQESNENTKPKNSIPIANAGLNVSNIAVDSILTLDGSGSNDIDGDPLSFKWSIVTKPSNSEAILSNSTAVNPTLVVDCYGIYKIQLIVNDTYCDSKPDIVELTATQNTVIVPDVKNVQLNEAQKILKESNLGIGKVNKKDHLSIPVGEIINQNPISGSNVLEGTNIDLVISTGKKPVVVPNVIGMTLSDATNAITCVDLQLGNISYEDSEFEPENQVLNQNPIAGYSLSEGESINLVVSQKAFFGKVTLKDQENNTYKIFGLKSIIENIILEYEENDYLKSLIPSNDIQILSNFLHIKIPHLSNLNQESSITVSVKYTNIPENIIIYDRNSNECEYLSFHKSTNGEISFQLNANRDVSFFPIISSKSIKTYDFEKDSIGIKNFELLENSGELIKIRISSFILKKWLPPFYNTQTMFEININDNIHSKDNIINQDGIIEYETTQSGLYEFKIYRLSKPPNELYPSPPVRFNLWRQKILVQTGENLEDIANSIAHKYAPILVFHDEEQYYPSSLDYIFNNDAKLNFSDRYYNINIPMNQARQYMANNGDTQGIIYTENVKEILRNKYGNRKVYYSLLARDNKFFLNFHFFYTYDEKPNKHQADHSFDRESITLVFNSLSSEPEFIIYAAHLSIQTMSLQKENETVQEWNGGRVKISWKDATLKGYICHDRPIICVARGSHGLFPVCGLYKISTYGFFPLTENAGGKDGFNHTAKWTNILVPAFALNDFPEDLQTYDINFLDIGHITSNNNQLGWLAYSGDWIDIIGPYNAKFPPFTEPERETNPNEYEINSYDWDILKVPWYSKKLMMELRKKLGCQLENEEIAWTGKTDILGRNIVDISPDISVNDKGYVAFIGKTERDGKLVQNIFVLDPYNKKISPMLLEIFEYPEKYEYQRNDDDYFEPRQTFDYPIINNQNYIISRRFLKAQVAFALFQLMEMPITCLEIWNAYGSSLPISQIASGTGGWSAMITFINPVTAGVYPSPYYPQSPWDGIYWNYNINNNGNAVYTALRKGKIYISTPITPPYNYNNIESEVEKPPWVQISDNNSIISLVGSGETANLYLSTYDFSSISIIAGANDGIFSFIGNLPAISDNGQFVAFYAVMTEEGANNKVDNPGPGIFVRNNLTQRIFRLCGISANGQLDPGETYIDINNNGVFDPNIDQDEGLIISIIEHNRICVNNQGTVIYCAMNDTNKKAIIASRIDFENAINPVIYDPIQVQAVGDKIDMLSTHEYIISDLNIFDSLNNQGIFGNVIFWIRSNNFQSIQHVEINFQM